MLAMPNISNNANEPDEPLLAPISQEAGQLKTNCAKFLIAAPMSGSGKTLVSTGLMSALQSRGFCVRPFKVGPDYIDPLHHLAVTGRVSHNLDAWMLGRQGCQELFTRVMATQTDGPDAWTEFLIVPEHNPRCTPLNPEKHSALHCTSKTQTTGSKYPNTPQPCIAVVEAAMGLFDGISGASNACSGAEMAYWLDLPIILVMDARSTARTAAAMIRGLHLCEPTTPLSAVIFNKVSSRNHAAMLAEAMNHMLPTLPVLGFLPHDATLGVAERHLGLILPDEQAHYTDQTKLSAWIEGNLNMDHLLEIAGARFVKQSMQEIPAVQVCEDIDASTTHKRYAIQSTCHKHTPVPAFPRTSDISQANVLSPAPQAPFPLTRRKKVRIAVARDAAFRFFYAENLRLLEKAGAELIPFSPIHDSTLPPETQGIYLCGGYPELFASELAQNHPMLNAIAHFINANGPAYAECGGMLYLGQSLTVPQNSQPHNMVGVLPIRFAMDTRRRGLGYRTARLITDSCLGPAGTIARGHEFHYSYVLKSEDMLQVTSLFTITNRENKDLGTTGYLFKKTAASYIHLHFGSCPDMADYFVQSCAAF